MSVVLIYIVLIPSLSSYMFQVVFEGFFDRGSRGHIWVDNIHMSTSTELEQCTRKYQHLELSLVS